MSPGSTFSRRSLLRQAASAAVSGFVVNRSAAANAGSGGADLRIASALPGRSGDARRRAVDAFRSARVQSIAACEEERQFPDGECSYSKALPHLADGRVDPAAYARLLKALRTGRRSDFERIPIGGHLKLAEPEAALDLHLSGPDALHLDPVLPPRFGSPAMNREILELYWMALLRDLPFGRYGESALSRSAAHELASSPDRLFRGPSAGDAIGPYVSQLLYLDVTMHPLRFEQRFRCPPPGADAQTRWEDRFASQNGRLSAAQPLENERRYIRNGRDLAEYVRRDFSYQAFLNAALVLLRIGTPTDGAEPNKHSRTRASFTGFGSPLVLHLVAAVAQPALRICWFYKWQVHRRIRPEELGSRLERPIAALDEVIARPALLGSEAIARCRYEHDTVLLPLAYQEGCPTHPAYPSGHAVVAGACATILKAFFDESFEIPAAVRSTGEGLALEPLPDARLAVGGEIDKLASNISFGRGFAGIHYRSDSEGGLILGEQIAVAFLRELLFVAPDQFTGWSFRSFAGERIVVA